MTIPKFGGKLTENFFVNGHKFRVRTPFYRH